MNAHGFELNLGSLMDEVQAKQSQKNTEFERAYQEHPHYIGVVDKEGNEMPVFFRDAQSLSALSDALPGMMGEDFVILRDVKRFIEIKRGRGPIDLYLNTANIDQITVKSNTQDW